MLMNALQSEGLLERFVIDEVHWVSIWGCNFRPDYKELHILKECYPEIPILGLTATVTRKMKQDLIKQLKLKDPYVPILSFNRPNLYFEVRNK